MDTHSISPPFFTRVELQETQGEVARLHAQKQSLESDMLSLKVSVENERHTLQRLQAAEAPLHQLQQALHRQEMEIRAMHEDTGAFIHLSLCAHLSSRPFHSFIYYRPVDSCGKAQCGEAAVCGGAHANGATPAAEGGTSGREDVRSLGLTPSLSSITTTTGRSPRVSERWPRSSENSKRLDFNSRRKSKLFRRESRKCSRTR